MAAKVQRMLERKIDLWDPEEVFELMPTLMKVKMQASALACCGGAVQCAVHHATRLIDQLRLID